MQVVAYRGLPHNEPDREEALVACKIGQAGAEGVILVFQLVEGRLSRWYPKDRTLSGGVVRSVEVDEFFACRSPLFAGQLKGVGETIQQGSE
jgi:hypothetical protein